MRGDFCGAIMHATVSRMKKILCLVLVSALAACSVSPKNACQEWVDSQELHSSYEQCVSCAKLHGTKDIHAVRSCTFRRDIEAIKR